MKATGRGKGAATAAAQSDAATATAGPFVFRLYVSGATPASARAVVNARRIFETHLPGRYRLEILEIGDHVGQATADQDDTCWRSTCRGTTNGLCTCWAPC